MEYIKKELKKFIALGIISIGILGFSTNFLILFGFLLLFEHIWSYNRWDFFDIFGHETLGILMIIIGLIMQKNYIGIIICIAGYLIGCNFKYEKDMSFIGYAKDKIKALFNITGE